MEYASSPLAQQGPMRAAAPPCLSRRPIANHLLLQDLHAAGSRKKLVTLISRSLNSADTSAGSWRSGRRTRASDRRA